MGHNLGFKLFDTQISKYENSGMEMIHYLKFFKEKTDFYSAGKE